MANFIKTQNSFANGEVAPEFYARDNINGLARMENMDVIAGGGLRRRRGLVHVTAIDSIARLVPFSVSDTENYLLALTDGHIMAYRDGVRVGDMISPWQYDDLAKLQYAQRFGTMIFVHPDYQPQTLRKTGTGFEITPFGFARNDADMTVNMPFVKFDDAEDIKITVQTHSSGNNYARLITNKSFWTSENVNGRLELIGKQWLVTQYVSPTEVVAYTNGTYNLPTSAVSDWREAAFGTRRGWPCSITFHQDRLVFGGSRSWPSGIWMSRVGRHNNFNIGTGLDDEAIFVTLLSQQRQQICTVVSSDNLQILTNVGEWAISNKPLTPAAVDVKQHTSVGSVTSNYLPPQKVEGATVFISGSKKDIRELSLDDLGENYNANDLCGLAKHLMNSPVDIAYNDADKQLFVVMADGTMAVLNHNSALGVSAWGKYKTDGKFLSVASMDGETFVAVRRGDGITIEKFASDALCDAETHDFEFTASALPLRGSGHNASRMRIRKITVRVLDTKTLFINGTRVTMPNHIYNDASPGFSGDVSHNLLGSHHDCMCSPWQISSADAQPVTILSVTTHGQYSV